MNNIFTRKSIYVVLFFVILIMVYADLGVSGDETMVDDVYEELYETWGGPVTEEKEFLAAEQMREADEKAAEGSSSLTSEERAAGNVHFLVATAGAHAQSLQERKETLQGKMDNLDDQSYAYNEAAQELGMLEQLDEPHGFYLIRAWRGMLDLIEPFFSVIFLAALILLGLTPVFADEHSKRTAGLILATKHGKRKVVTAKIMATLTYIVVVFSSLHVVNLFVQWMKYGGFQGWDAPMQSLPATFSFTNFLYEQSPFAWDVWQFYATTLSVQFLACVALAILVLFISMLVKNTMIAFFVSGAILGIPYMFRQLGLEAGIFEYINGFSYLEFIRVERLFQEFSAYNVFGYPVLYPLMLLSIFTVLTVVIVLLTYYRFARQQVTG